jgi:hypothetical protein
LTSPTTSLVDLVQAVRDLPYGRPTYRTVEGMLKERRGTCSTKHLFLAQALVDRFPETDPRIVHRVYRLDRAHARDLYGDEVADAVSDAGLTDVHRFLTVVLEDQRVDLDATFAGELWDGRSSLPPSCGPGTDYLAGEDPDVDKLALEMANCDPAIREPFIAALTSVFGHTAPSSTATNSS